MMIKLIETDGTNQDFIALCKTLDDYLDSIAGKERQAMYNPFNTLEDIHNVLLAYNSDMPVACAGFKRYDALTAEIKRVFVKEAYRGKGISKRLLLRLEEMAKVQGYQTLILETGEPLIAAMGLYRSLGYEVINNYGQYADLPESVCMRKTI